MTRIGNPSTSRRGDPQCDPYHMDYILTLGTFVGYITGMEIIAVYVIMGLLFIYLVDMGLEISAARRQERRDRIVIKNLVKTLDDTTQIR